MIEEQKRIQRLQEHDDNEDAGMETLGTLIALVVVCLGIGMAYFLVNG